jgi:hypothetical protein
MLKKLRGDERKAYRTMKANIETGNVEFTYNLHRSVGWEHDEFNIYTRDWELPLRLKFNFSAWRSPGSQVKDAVRYLEQIDRSKDEARSLLRKLIQLDEITETVGLKKVSQRLFNSFDKDGKYSDDIAHRLWTFLNQAEEDLLDYLYLGDSANLAKLGKMQGVV